jgi:Tyrosine phosphatase family
MTAAVEAPPIAPPRRRHLPARPMLWVLAAAILAPLLYEMYQVLVGFNFHVVVPGRIYRCAQPSAAALEQLIVNRGIRTVVNLRGTGDPIGWYLDEVRTTHNYDICQEDINFSAGRLPSASELRRLILVLERTPYPIVLHCRRGSDRTGMASAVAVLLTTDEPLEDAFRQLHWRFGHVALGRPAELDQFLGFYKDWLTAEGKQHSAANFRSWAVDHYCPGCCWSELAFAEPPPATVSSADPTTLNIHVRNASLAPWVLKPQLTAGVHLGCFIYDERDHLVEQVRSGLRDGVIRPGESTDFTLVLPPLRQPGNYRLQIDMVEEQQCWFYQTGSEPLEMELIVRE